MTETKIPSMLPSIIQIVYNGILLIIFLASDLFLWDSWNLFIPVIIAIAGNIAASLIINIHGIDLTPYAGGFVAAFVFPTVFTSLTVLPIYLFSPNDYTALFILTVVYGLAFIISSAIFYRQAFLRFPADKQRLRTAVVEFAAAALCNPNLYVIISMLFAILHSVAAYHFDWRD